MRSSFIEQICDATGANNFQITASLQTLWSGYGEILRVALEGSPTPTAIVKHIVLPEEAMHPRGWNTSCSHQRKLRSYDIETTWYKRWSERCGPPCRVPAFYGAWEADNERVLLLEDLDDAGFPARRHSLARAEVVHCLTWLAHFHATFLGESPDGLWPVGTYWHLETRPDELAAMPDSALKEAAPLLDELLNSCQYQTFVHGDAKVANFCFSEDFQAIAAVDFQYVGGGCGIKDVIYLLGSCLDEDQCEALEADLLDAYFLALHNALRINGKAEDTDILALEEEWRKLFPVAWTDFYRFLQGWMPGHRKINAYSERLASETLAAL